MSTQLNQPLEIAQTVLELLKDVDNFTAVAALKIAHLACEHQQAIAIANS
jgi:hypothetical protein